MTAALLVGMLVTAVQPSYVLERMVSIGDQVHRISVFRDGTVALVRSQSGGPPDVRRQRLHPAELRLITQVAEQAYDDVARLGGLGGAPGGATAEYRLAPPGREALVVVNPSGSVTDSSRLSMS